LSAADEDVLLGKNGAATKKSNSNKSRQEEIREHQSFLAAMEYYSFLWHRPFLSGLFML